MQGVATETIPGLLLRSAPFPLVLRSARSLSEDELFDFCVANEPLRIERQPSGDLSVITPAGGTTSNREGYLFRELDLWVERQGSGIAFNSNGGFLLPDGSMRSPDAAWLSAEKWESLTVEQQRKFVPSCPEFVVELRSPSDIWPDLMSKMEAWLRNGAQLAWLIDPDRKIAVLYRAGRPREVLEGPEFLEGEGPVAGFRLKMQRLWQS